MRDGDTTSLSSFQTGSFVHANRPLLPEDGSHQPRSRKTKAQLWNEVKLTSITRAFTLIYSLSLLTILTRIQLNLLGRLNYISSVVSLAQPPPPGRVNSISLEDHDDGGAGAGAANLGNDFETNRRYLTFSWYLLHKGYAQVMEKVDRAVEEVFGGISPSESLTASRLSDLVLAVRRKVEGSSEQERYATRWLPYMLPPREEEELVLFESGVVTPPPSSPRGSPHPQAAAAGGSGSHEAHDTHTHPSTGTLRQLLDETADLIDSPAFTRVHTLLLNSMFSHLIDTRVIGQLYPQSNVQSPPSSISNAPQPRIQELDSAVTVVPAEPRVKLANILAVLTRQAHAIGNGNDPPNEYVSVAETEVKELEAFAAVVYASNLHQSVEESRPKSAEDSAIRASGGTGVSDVGTEPIEEMIESKLESAWTKVTGSTISST